MEDSLKQQALVVLAIVLVLIAQCQSIVTYKCTDDMTTCGCTRRPGISPKIRGGQSALSSNWDWMVSIGHLNRHFCGGSVLNEWYIITAAHCFENITSIRSRIRICAGSFRLSDRCHQSRRMHSVILHPLYNTTTNENDIALVRLTTPLDFSDSSITPICLPSTNDPDEYPAVGTQVVSIGWGHLKTNETPDELQEVTLKIMDKSSIHCDLLYNDRIQLCAGDLGKGSFCYRFIQLIVTLYFLLKGASKGDSGGPLMVLTALKQWELIGLVSYAKSNPDSQSGDAYTLIAPFLEFVQTPIRKPSIHPTKLNCLSRFPITPESGGG